MEKVVYTKNDLKEALENNCETIIIQDEGLAKYIRYVKTGSELLFYLGFISILGVFSLGILTLTLTHSSSSIVRFLSATTAAAIILKLSLILVAFIFFEVTVIYSLYRDYDLKNAVNIELDNEKRKNSSQRKDSVTAVLKKRNIKI